MPVKQKTVVKGNEEILNQRVGELSQLDLPAMSLMSLLQFGSATLLKEAIANEITAYLGRSHYQHGNEFKGHRNGSQQTRLDTAMGTLEYDRPKIANAPDFKSQFHVPHMRMTDFIQGSQSISWKGATRFHRRVPGDFIERGHLYLI